MSDFIEEPENNSNNKIGFLMEYTGNDSFYNQMERKLYDPNEIDQKKGPLFTFDPTTLKISEVDQNYE